MTAVWYLSLVLSLVVMLQLLQPWHLSQFPKTIIMSQWKCLEKFLQGEWTEYSLWTVTEYGAVSSHPGRKVPITICLCSPVKRDENVCSRIDGHKELDTTVALHLLKTYYASDIFTTQYLPSLQKFPKADNGFFSLQRITLRFKGPRACLKSHCTSSKVSICTHVPSPEAVFPPDFILPPQKSEL